MNKGQLRLQNGTPTAEPKYEDVWLCAFSPEEYLLPVAFKEWEESERVIFILTKGFIVINKKPAAVVEGPH